jgi:hypothetical protein
MLKSRIVSVALSGLALSFAFATRPAQAQASATPASAAATPPIEEKKITVEESGSVKKLLERIFVEAGVSYVIGPLPGTEATISVHNVPFRDALTVFLQAAAPELTYRVEQGVYLIVRKAPEAATAAPVPTPAVTPASGPMVAVTPPTGENAVLVALTLQLANLKADRAAALIDNPEGSSAIQRLDARIAATEKEIARLRSEALANAPVEAMRSQVIALQQRKVQMFADGYTPTCEQMTLVNQQIQTLEKTIAEREAANSAGPPR